MQIIFGDSVKLVRERFTVLELDTFQVAGTDQTITTWCVIEKIPLEEITISHHLVKLHQDMMDQYRQKQWDFCLQALEQLKGRWDREADTFYHDLEARVKYLQQNPPDETWTPVRVKIA